ncbi:MAG: lysophospholipid acyltransferase family protein, partial [Armatimonadota bacterium]
MFVGEERSGVSLYRFAWRVVRIFFAVCPMRVVGHENVPQSGPALLAANHVSYLDPPAIGCALERECWFMAKAELFSLPILGPLLPRLHAFPVHRGTADRAAIRRCLELLADGKLVTVFPEGTRSPDGRLMKAEAGIGIIALWARAPVVPVALTGTDRALPRHSPFLRPAPITVRIGEPLTFEDLSADRRDRSAVDEVGNRVMLAIADLLA